MQGKTKTIGQIFTGAALAFGAVAGTVLYAGTAGHAMQLDAKQAKPEFVLSYAEPAPQRFEMIDRVSYPDEDSYADEGMYSGEEAHVLNDAWLGMSVVSQEGINIGYVTDAYIDENGDLDELVVVPADADTDMLATPVFVPARFAKLGSSAVNVSLTAEAFATLEPAPEYAMAAE